MKRVASNQRPIIEPLHALGLVCFCGCGGFCGDRLTTKPACDKLARKFCTEFSVGFPEALR